MIKLFRDTDIGGSLSGGPDPIPEDVRKKIRDEYEGTSGGAMEIDAAEWAYETLALPTIQAQEERIRVLEEANKGLTSALAEAIQMSTDLVKTIKES